MKLINNTLVLLTVRARTIRRLERLYLNALRRGEQTTCRKTNVLYYYTKNQVWSWCFSGRFKQKKNKNCTI